MATNSLSVAGFMLANTKKLNFGSSIASIYARDAFTSRRGLLSLQALYGDRFILGLGVSHVPMVEGIRGHKYEKPVPAMRAYLDGIAKGEAGSDNWPLAIAALGPLMLKLAASHTRGALPYNTTPQHTAEAARILGPGKWLVAEQKVSLETDPAKARVLGRKELSRYMTLDNYRNNWLRIGFSEAELANGGSDRFIDAMLLWGSANKVPRWPACPLRRGRHACVHPTGARGWRHSDARPHPDRACQHLTGVMPCWQSPNPGRSHEPRWPMCWRAAVAAG